MLPCYHVESLGSDDVHPHTALVYGTVAHPQGMTAYQAVAPELRREGPIGKIERIARPGRFVGGKDYRYGVSGTGTKVDGSEYASYFRAVSVVYSARYPTRKVVPVPYCTTDALLNVAVGRLLAAGVTIVHAESSHDRLGYRFVEVEDDRDRDTLMAIAASLV